MLAMIVMPGTPWSPTRPNAWMEPKLTPFRSLSCELAMLFRFRQEPESQPMEQSEKPSSM
jgi:hypothetical protein